MSEKPRIARENGEWWVTWPDGSRFSYATLDLAASHTAKMLKQEEQPKGDDGAAA